MSTVIWISIAAAVVLLVALAVGLLLARRRRISIVEKPDQQVEAPPAPRRYQAGGSISFSSGGGGPPEAPQTPAPPQASAPAPPKPPAPPASPKPPAQTRPAPTRPQTSAPPKAPVQAPPPKPRPQPRSRPKPSAPPADLAPPPSAEPATPAPAQPVEALPPTSAPAPPEPDRAEPAPAEPLAAEPPPSAPPLAEPVLAEPEPAPAEPELAEQPAVLLEPIDAPEGRLVRLRGRLARSRSAFGQSLLGLLGAGDLDEDSWTDVEDTLLLADLGAATTTEIVEALRTELAQRGVRTTEQARAALRDVLIEALRPELDRAVRALPHEGADGVSVPGVVLIAGVNGTGKTTTTGKLARVLVASGRRVLLGAADTFRAAAVDQLATWGERAGAEVVRGAEGADPASVAFEAVKRGSADGVDTVLIDTAGRLHTKTGLMDELGKVKRVVSKQTEVDEVLLVLDATTGQNGMMQARVFREVVDVTGIVLTKLDGTAKGGIVFHVQRELGVPVKLVGLGEGVDDLAPFEPAAFVDALLD
ncbi:MAG: signal recognition particle-docking protein FtsY [Pseudonocardiaceae bacterium]